MVKKPATVRRMRERTSEFKVSRKSARWCSDSNIGAVCVQRRSAARPADHSQPQRRAQACRLGLFGVLTESRKFARTSTHRHRARRRLAAGLRLVRALQRVVGGHGKRQLMARTGELLTSPAPACGRCDSRHRSPATSRCCALQEGLPAIAWSKCAGSERHLQLHPEPHAV